MNRLRSMLTLPPLALAACAALCGCIPETQSPLVDPAAARPDYALMGLWQIKQENGDVQYYHIGLEPEKPLDPQRSTPESGLMKFWLITHGAQNRQVSNPFGMPMFVTTVGDAQYAHLVLDHTEAGATPARTYWLMKYHVDADTLTTWGMGWQSTAKVIQDGKLPGKVERDEKGELKRVLLTATADELKAFLKDNSSALFPPDGKTTYKRVAPAG